MKLEDIEASWREDSKIDRFDLTGESLKIPQLHAKYYRIFMGEKALAIKLQNDIKVLRLEKHEFYTQGPTSETPSHWKLPDAGRVPRADAERYLDADKDIIDLSMRYQMQVEKTKLVESILHSINFRSNAIRNAIDMIKFEAGER